MRDGVLSDKIVESLFALTSIHYSPLTHISDRMSGINDIAPARRPAYTQEDSMGEKYDEKDIQVSPLGVHEVGHHLDVSERDQVKK